MKEEPLVSVMVLCYNHKDFVVQALDSVLNQTYKNIEVIIIDDNSSDGSQELIEKWVRDNKVACRFIKHTSNRPIGYSYNEFLKLAKGKYISAIATDDLFYPSKTEKQVALFATLTEEYGVVYSDLNVIDRDNNLLDNSFYKWYLKDTEPTSGNLLDAFMKCNPVQVTGTLVKREIYDKVGPYDESMVGEDWDMGLRWARICKFFYHNEVVGAYRRSLNQFNAVASRDKKLQFKIQDMIHRIFIKHLDLEGDFRNKVVDQLKSNHKEMLSSEYLARKQNIEISTFLFKTKPSFISLVILITAYFNIPNLYPSVKSMMNRLSLFVKKRITHNQETSLKESPTKG